MTFPPSFGTFPEIHPFWYRHPSLTIDLIIACIARIPFNSITENKMIGTILNSHALIGNWDYVVFQHFFAQILLLILLAIIIGDVINIFTRNLFRGQSTCVNMSGTHFTPLGRPQKTFISPASSSFPKTNIVMIVIKASLVF